MFKINRFSLIMLAISVALILTSCGPWPTVVEEPVFKELVVSPQIRCVDDPLTITWSITQGQKSSGDPVGNFFVAKVKEPFVRSIFRSDELSDSIVVHLEADVFDGEVPNLMKSLFYIDQTINGDEQYGKKEVTIRTIYQNEEFPNRPASQQPDSNWEVIFPLQQWSSNLVAVKFGVTFPENLRDEPEMRFQYDKGTDVTGILDAGNNWEDNIAILPPVAGTWTVSPANDFTRQILGKDDLKAMVTVICA